jgi:hypothetical protein
MSPRASLNCTRISASLELSALPALRMKGSKELLPHTVNCILVVISASLELSALPALRMKGSKELQPHTVNCILVVKETCI